MTWKDDEQISCAAAQVKTLTQSKIDGAAGGARMSRAFIQNGPTSNTAVRYRLTGSDPTSSVGHELTPGQNVTIDGYDNLKNFKMILSGGVTATVQVSYGN